MLNWPELGKVFIIVGVLLTMLGFFFLFKDKLPFAPGRLPGDIVIKRDNFTFYFPLGTCILLSVILSLIFFLWRR